MLTHDTFITIKPTKDSSIINTSLTALYSAVGNKEFYAFGGNIEVPCRLKQVKVDEEQVYLLSLGQRFLEATGDTLVVTMKGVKLLKDIKTTDLIEIYNPDDIDFAGTPISYANIHTVECRQPNYKGFLFKLESESHAFINLYNGMAVGS